MSNKSWFYEQQWAGWRAAKSHFDQFAAGVDEAHPEAWMQVNQHIYIRHDPTRLNITWHVEKRVAGWVWFTISTESGTRFSSNVGPFSSAAAAMADAETANK